MRAMMLEGIAGIDRSSLKMRQVDIPKPGSGQILVRVECCGVCHTDLHTVEGEWRSRRFRECSGTRSSARSKLLVRDRHGSTAVLALASPGCTPLAVRAFLPFGPGEPGVRTPALRASMSMADTRNLSSPKRVLCVHCPTRSPRPRRRPCCVRA